MRTLVYCAKDKRKQAQQELKLDYDHIFVSPTYGRVDYSAERVVVVGKHQHIADKYKGIIDDDNIETVQLKSNADATDDS